MIWATVELLAPTTTRVVTGATSGKGGGEFYTPSAVGKLGAKLLAPEPGDDSMNVIAVSFDARN